MRLALPDHDYLPAQTTQSRPRSPVSIHILLELARPEGNTSLWRVSVSTPPMAVPEATVDEDNGPVF
jgi:hypothetical protein